MLIKKLEKKKSKYLVLIEDKEYTFVEDVILKYKILENHEIDSKTLEEAISLNHILEYYDKALSYHLKYGKGSFEIKRYLYDKGLNDYEATKIVNLMIERKILDDDKLLDSLIESL
ncbi:MAG: hypothetical protein K6B64_04500, partial [Acholeplasmatales bacterium]|nr:hypothetical protein [Acholeplasmatales bacterium]